MGLNPLKKFRRKKQKEGSHHHYMEQPPVLADLGTDEEEEEEHSDDFSVEIRKTVSDSPTSVVPSSKNYTTHQTYSTMKKIQAAPPLQLENVLKGPPRYEWFDIESAAAIKIQSVVRRNFVLADLEDANMTTTRMRNRKRQRLSRKRDTVTDDVPFIFKMCGVGFLFGDATAEEEEVQKQRRRAAYEEKRRQQWALEEQKRRYKYRQSDTEILHEGYEVVDH